MPSPRLIALLLSGALLLGACGDDAVDQVVDDAKESVENAADTAVADQLATLIVERTSLERPDAECVSNEVINRLGTSRVVELLIDTGGDVGQLGDAERQEVQSAVQAAGEACDVEPGEVFQG